MMHKDKLFEMPRHIRGEIRRKQLRVEELETILMPNAIRYDIEKVQHEPTDNLADIVAEIAEVKKKIERLKNELMKVQGAIDKRIRTLTSEGQQKVMYCRYIRCLSQNQTAERLGISRESVNQFERKAFRKLR